MQGVLLLQGLDLLLDLLLIVNGSKHVLVSLHKILNIGAFWISCTSDWRAQIWSYLF